MLLTLSLLTWPKAAARQKATKRSLVNDYFCLFILACPKNSTNVVNQKQILKIFVPPRKITYAYLICKIFKTKPRLTCLDLRQRTGTD